MIQPQASSTVIVRAAVATAAFSLRTVGAPRDLSVAFSFDLMLPGLGGRDLADRARIYRPKLRVLFMSGYADRLPDAPLLAKPFSAEELAVAVRRALDAP